MSPKKSTIAPTGRASSSRATTITSKPTTAQARTIGKKPHFEAKFKRMDDLKAKYGAVSAALKPALLEIANRTANELQNDTHYHRTGANKDQLEAVETELKKARDRAIAEISAQTTLKMETVQRKTEFDMWQVGQQYEAKLRSIRERQKQEVGDDLDELEREREREVCWSVWGVFIFESGDFSYVDEVATGQ